MSIEQSYDTVLKDLESRRQRCIEEIQMLDGMIANLRQFLVPQRTVATGASPASVTQVAPQIPRPPIRPIRSTEPSQSQRYTGMSVRWAILYLLAEYASGPMGTAEIAKALEEGGITSRGQNFRSNVSAIVSVMVNQRQELEQSGDGYQITQHGLDVWGGIKQTPQWLTRATIAS